MNFWASWCVPCREEFPLFKDQLATLGARDGLQVRRRAVQGRADARRRQFLDRLRRHLADRSPTPTGRSRRRTASSRRRRPTSSTRTASSAGSRSARSGRRTSTTQYAKIAPVTAAPSTPAMPSPTGACTRPTAARRSSSGVSLEVGRGELFALLGPNGAGKTTTVEILEGYRRRRRREVRVLGLDPVRDGRRLRPRIGLMLQEGGVDPRTTPARGAPPVRPLLPRPGGPGRAPRAGRPRPWPRRPGTGACRAARRQRLGARARARRAAGARSSSTSRPRAWIPAAKQATRERIAGAARRRDDDPAHDPRAGRRRAARRPGRRARPRPGRRRRDAGRAHRRRGAAGPVPARRRRSTRRAPSRWPRRSRRAGARSSTTGAGAPLRAARPRRGRRTPRARRRARRVVRGARAADRRAPRRRGEPRGALPRAGRARSGAA